MIMKTSTPLQSFIASKKLLSAKCNDSKCTIEKEWLNCDCVGNQETSFILVWSTICVADSPLTVKYLKYMDSARHANAQLMRWVMFLQRYNFKVEAINLTIFLFPFLLKRGLCCKKLSSVTSVTLHDYSQIVYFRSSVSVLLLDLFERSRTRLRFWSGSWVQFLAEAVFIVYKARVVSYVVEMPLWCHVHFWNNYNSSCLPLFRKPSWVPYV